MPAPSVTTVRTFSMRAGLAASTVTPGSTAPDVSRTVPVSVPRANAPCALASDGVVRANKIARPDGNVRCIRRLLGEFPCIRPGDADAVAESAIWGRRGTSRRPLSRNERRDQHEGGYDGATLPRSTHVTTPRGDFRECESARLRRVRRRDGADIAEAACGSQKG